MHRKIKKIKQRFRLIVTSEERVCRVVSSLVHRGERQRQHHRHHYLSNLLQTLFSLILSVSLLFLIHFKHLQRTLAEGLKHICPPPPRDFILLSPSRVMCVLISALTTGLNSNCHWGVRRSRKETTSVLHSLWPLSYYYYDKRQIKLYDSGNFRQKWNV